MDLVLGTQDRHALPALLDQARKRARPLVQVSDVFAARALPVIPVRRFTPGYTRAFVKVQDGCQHRCSFCIVPFARGGSRSQAVEAVVEQVEGLVGAGYAEVVLTGVDLGHYGWDLSPRTTLAGSGAAAPRRAAGSPGSACRPCCPPTSPRSWSS